MELFKSKSRFVNYLYTIMSTIQIEILNPKAIRLIQDLADLELISIKYPMETGFSTLLAKLRSKAESVPNLEEITKEVEIVREARNEEKNQSYY
jgi:hypothetical protein